LGSRTSQRTASKTQRSGIQIT